MKGLLFAFVISVSFNIVGYYRANQKAHYLEMSNLILTDDLESCQRGNIE